MNLREKLKKQVNQARIENHLELMGLFTSKINRIISTLETTLEAQAASQNTSVELLSFHCEASFFGRFSPQTELQRHVLKEVNRLADYLNSRGLKVSISRKHFVIDGIWKVVVDWS